MNPRCLRFLLVLVVGLFAMGCDATAASAARPNFVIFIADDVSWDDFGCTGNLDVQTPRIDQLARAGSRFNQVYLTASSCSPSRNSIMTGRYPHNTGAAELHTQPPVEMVSFPEILRQNGYYCGQAGKFHMGEYAHRGFDVAYHRGAELGDGGEASWLKVVSERPREKPFFFWLAALDAHRGWGTNEFSGTHDPDTLTVPPHLADGDGTRRDLAHYYDEIRRFDHHIGLVLDELERQGALQNTVVVVMADNGRPFPHSKTRVNDRGMKTPFVVHWPAWVGKGTVSEALISVIDIAPTLLDLAGIEVARSFQGRSFRSVLENPEAPHRRYVFAEHNWHDREAHERMVRSGDFMYIRNYRPWKPQLGPNDSIASPAHTDLLRLQAAGELSAIQADLFVVPRPKEELYDLRKDSEQLLNLASVPAYAQDLVVMRAVMDEWMEITGDTVPANLTQDYFLPYGEYIRTAHYGTRGEMPGAARNATEIDEGGPF